MLARAYACLALVCGSFVPCLLQMIRFEEAAATKTRYSDNDSNMRCNHPGAAVMHGRATRLRSTDEISQCMLTG